LTGQEEASAVTRLLEHSVTQRGGRTEGLHDHLRQFQNVLTAQERLHAISELLEHLVTQLAAERENSKACNHLRQVENAPDGNLLEHSIPNWRNGRTRTFTTDPSKITTGKLLRQ
jgi:hypothetical protein